MQAPRALWIVRGLAAGHRLTYLHRTCGDTGRECITRTWGSTSCSWVLRQEPSAEMATPRSHGWLSCA